MTKCSWKQLSEELPDDDSHHSAGARMNRFSARRAVPTSSMLDTDYADDDGFEDDFEMGRETVGGPVPRNDIDDLDVDLSELPPLNVSDKRDAASLKDMSSAEVLAFAKENWYKPQKWPRNVQVTAAFSLVAVALLIVALCVVSWVIVSSISDIANGANVPLPPLPNDGSGGNVVISSSSGEEPPHGGSAFRYEQIRLPTWVIPLHYQLDLTPNMIDPDWKYSGTVDITIFVQEKTSRLVLHADELQIISASVNGVSCSWIGRNEKTQLLLLALDQELSQGSQVTLQLVFTGTHNDLLRGFYRSLYTDTNGLEHRLVTTQFEPTDARRAFPCFDEPALKATFELSLRVDVSQWPTVLGNTQEVSRQIIPGPYPRLTRVKFAVTPLMSTYLLAFVVCDFERVTQQSTHALSGLPLDVSVYMRPGQTSQGSIALDQSVQLIAFYEQWFAMDVPLAKMDLIAIPDFAAGAMENWGLITYRETDLLLDPAAASPSNMLRVTSVVAHELAHQWFGDIVTMAWWSDLWLNEGFASFMQYVSMGALWPEYHYVDPILYLEDTKGALRLDARTTSHPIFVEVANPLEINEIFDGITYSKGCAIIRMLQQNLGEQIFQTGIRAYMKAHAYGNAATDDLWSSLQAASGVDVKAMMDSWTLQMGFPVLSVSLTSARTLVAQQHRFLSSSNEAAQSSLARALPQLRSADLTNYAYDVNVQYYVEGMAGMQDADTMLSSHTPAILSHIPVPLGASVKLNAGQTGFYRVKYASNLWNSLTAAIAAQSMPEVDRAGVLDDAFAFAEAGDADYTYQQALSLLRSGSDNHDTSYAWWTVASDNIYRMDALLDDESIYGAFSQWIAAQTANAVSYYGWEYNAGENTQTPEPYLQSKTRPIVLSLAAHFEVSSVVTEAVSRFWAHMQSGVSLDPALRDFVYRTAVEHDANAYAVVKTQYLSPLVTAPQERRRLLYALAACVRPWQVTATLEFALSPSVKVQDTSSLIGRLARNPAARDKTWDFLQDNWPEFERRYGGGGFAISGLVSSVLAQGKSTSLQMEVADFFAGTVLAGTRTVDQVLEKIRSNAAWVTKNREIIATVVQ
jgi:aminopeptidase N